MLTLRIQDEKTSKRSKDSNGFLIIKDNPIAKTTVPVINGGKNLRIRLMFNPTSKATIPPTICAPRMVAISYSPAIACILGT